jgi:hypothetical protein
MGHIATRDGRPDWKTIGARFYVFFGMAALLTIFVTLGARGLGVDIDWGGE